MKRATAAEKLFILFLIISIHALVKRATYNLCKRLMWAAISIHALVKRATSSDVISVPSD